MVRINSIFLKKFLLKLSILCRTPQVIRAVVRQKLLDQGVDVVRTTVKTCTVVPLSEVGETSGFCMACFLCFFALFFLAMSHVRST